MQLKTSIEKLMRKENLDALHCEQVLTDILTEETNPLQLAAFLVLLRSKQETSEEICGLVTALKQQMIPVITDSKVLDIVGTGGDAANTLNISTASAILAASCGIKIAKHGNRAVSSLAGSADVLEALGLRIDLPPEKISASIAEVGIGFCFAPNFHPALRELRKFRQQLNLPTTLNILGPLLNPCNPAHLLMGVYDEKLLEIMAEALQNMGSQRSMVVYGNGVDEISCLGPTKIVEITATTRQAFVLDPEELGLERCTLRDLQGRDTAYNARKLLDVLHGTSKNKALAETLMLNAAVALYLYGLHPSIKEALAHAKQNLITGKALALLNHWIEFSHD